MYEYGHMTRIGQVDCDASGDLVREGGDIPNVVAYVPMEHDGTFQDRFQVFFLRCVLLPQYSLAVSTSLLPVTL